YFTKATGAPMFGYHVELKGTGNPYYPLKVRTTLDKRLQQILEKDVDQAGLSKGGAVLLKADNSNLLAMVNRPLYDSHHPYASGGKNYMVLPQIPGSVFKMVTAAAAIEMNAVDPNRLYDCNRTVYGEEGATRQLGKLTFLQSFAQSCNRTFAVTANELILKDRNYMERYAKKLGLIGPVGWKGNVDHEKNFRQIPEEEAGLIWEDSSYKNNPKSVAQTAIGQLNVRISPLAVANAMATIARGGKKLAVRAADEVDYANGVKLTGFPLEGLPGGRITPYTAMELQKFLSKVVDSPEGTGHILSGLPFDVAGKSGTAETGTGADNHWFAGYFPASDPQYVLVVVNLDRHAGDMKTYQIYKQVVKDLYNLNRAD
ncbi:MAG TPA: penicillin-binding transpeptidase domain-containing protein, partial [Bacillales bacterium]|nr:penicillin-binding transpeptidase domain-containing protein [Bacillales bacterium]